jgi:DNA repair protein RecO (recombination protein O)
MTKEYQVPCYILHRRPYRETSAIIDVIGEGFGRLSLIVRGVYNTKNKSALGAKAQVFRPLLINFSGGGDLKYVQTIEDNGPPIGLSEKYLYSGFYVNELICRLWPQNIQSDELFELYQQTVMALMLCEKIAHGQKGVSSNADLEIALRTFEFDLLVALGYGVDCFHTFDHDEAIDPEQNYLFLPEHGFTQLDPYDPNVPDEPPFNGTIILAIGEQDFSRTGVLKAAKRLSRRALAPHLDYIPLKSRELFMSLRSSTA